MKQLKFLVITSICALTLFTLSACEDGDKIVLEEGTYYQVEFDTHGANKINKIKVLKNHKITEPELPIKNSEEFAGWYTDEEYTTKWNFAIDTVKKDITLHAKWITKFAFKFNSLGGPTIEQQILNPNTAAIEPSPWPERDGYKFRGWYTDNTFKSKWDFANLVTQDTEVFAKWAKILVASFDSKGGSVLLDQKKDEDKPEEARKLIEIKPVKLGYKFLGWYTDEGYTTAWDFNTPITQDIHLIAKWEKIITANKTATINPNGGNFNNLTTAQSINLAGDKTYIQELMQGNLTRDGYVFAGWCKDSACAEPLVTTSIDELENQTLYANWHKLVDINAASFTMGASKHGEFKVKLTQNYQMSAYVTTREMYSAVMLENLNLFSTDPSSKKDENFLPVHAITWNNAVVFCNRLSKIHGLTPAYKLNGETDTDKWIPDQWDSSINTETVYTWDKIELDSTANGFRLPTEAEWEFAARNADDTNGDKYIAISTDTIDDIAWHKKNSGKVLHPVGKKAPLKIGLYDMAGNIYEYVYDWFNAYPPKRGETQSEYTDYIAPKAFGERTKVARGGYFQSNHFIIKPSYRRECSDTCGDNASFRVVRNAN